MKKLQIVISSIIAFSITSFGALPAYAVTGSQDQNNTTVKEAETAEVKELTAEEKAKKLADMKKRLEENKALLKTKVDEATKKRIVAKCKPAQGIVKGAETSAKAVTTNRNKAYSKISESVQKLIDKLKANGKDTTELEAAHAVAKQKADVLKTKMAAYEQSLADLQEMDCAADPTAFQAALESARAQREAVKTAATDLRTYISTTLKAAINKVKATAQESTESTGGTQ